MKMSCAISCQIEHVCTICAITQKTLSRKAGCPRNLISLVVSHNTDCCNLGTSELFCLLFHSAFTSFHLTIYTIATILVSFATFPSDVDLQPHHIPPRHPGPLTVGTPLRRTPLIRPTGSRLANPPHRPLSVQASPTHTAHIHVVSALTGHRLPPCQPAR